MRKHRRNLQSGLVVAAILWLAAPVWAQGASDGVHAQGSASNAPSLLEPEPPKPLPEDLDVPFADLAVGEAFSLDEVTRMAVANSLDINIFRVDREIKVADLPIAEAMYDTNVTIDAEYEIDEEQPASSILGSRAVTGEVATTVETLLPTGTEVTVTHTARRESSQSPFASLSRLYKGSAELAVTQPIMRNRFGVIDRAKVQSVRLDVRRFDHETTDRIEAQVLVVRDTYWDLVFAHRDLDSKRRALRQAQEFLRTTEEKLVFGLVESQDAYAAEANVRLRVVDVLEVQTDLENQRETLQVLLDLSFDVTLVPSTVPEFGDVAADLEQSLLYAHDHRRDLRQLALELEIGDLAVRMKRSGLLPQLDLHASYRSSGLDRDLWDAQGEIGGFNHPTYFAGFTFKRAIENQKAEAELRQAELTRQRILLQMRQLKREIDREVREAIRQLRLASSRAKHTQQAVVLQQSKLVEEGKAYHFGRSDSRTIIDFQEDVIAAETQAESAVVTYRKAADALLRAEHRLLDATGVLNK